MKTKTMNIIKTFFAIAILAAFTSCSGLNSTKSDTSENPVLKIALSQSQRTVVPDCDFSTFSFVLKSGETTLGTYSGSTALQNDVIDLASNDINVGDDVTFTLTAQKGDISWSGSTNATIQAGENIVELKLLITALGTGNGSFEYTLDYSSANDKKQVVSAHVVVTSLDDSTADPLIDQWYGLDEDGNTASKPIPQDYKIVLEKSNISVGSYNITAEFFADSKPTAKVRDWSESIVVAAGTKSTGTAQISSTSHAYTVTYDLNYEGSSPYQEKVTYFTNLDAFEKPKRNGYIFKDWYLDQECSDSKKFYGYQNIDSPSGDTTVYAKWEEFAPGAPTVTIYDTDTLYVNSDNYNMTTLNWYTESQRTSWFKIPTVPGNKYKICWIGYYTRGTYDFVYNGDLVTGEGPFAPSNITLYRSDASELTIKTLNDDTISYPNERKGEFFFIAESTETIVKLEVSQGCNGVGAFRVTNYNPDVQVTDSLHSLVKVLVEEIEVTKRRSGKTDYSHMPYQDYAPWNYSFNVVNSSDYEDFKWYLNGKPVGNSYSISFHCDDYPLGIYTISLEAKKKSDGEWYSYCAQFTISESDHS